MAETRSRYLAQVIINFMKIKPSHCFAPQDDTILVKYVFGEKDGKSNDVRALLPNL